MDEAEVHQKHAFDINAHAAGLLAEMCAKNDISIIHISTDYVFDGISKIPYKETDETSPLTIYGKSKLLGRATSLSKSSRIMYY